MDLRERHRYQMERQHFGLQRSLEKTLCRAGSKGERQAKIELQQDIYSLSKLIRSFIVNNLFVEKQSSFLPINKTVQLPHTHTNGSQIL